MFLGNVKPHLKPKTPVNYIRWKESPLHEFRVISDLYLNLCFYFHLIYEMQKVSDHA